MGILPAMFVLYEISQDPERFMGKGLGQRNKTRAEPD